MNLGILLLFSKKKRNFKNFKRNTGNPKIGSISSIVVEMRYFSEENFVGCPIDGYNANKCLLSVEAADALLKVRGVHPICLFCLIFLK